MAATKRPFCFGYIYIFLFFSFLDKSRKSIFFLLILTFSKMATTKWPFCLVMYIFISLGLRIYLCGVCHNFGRDRNNAEQGAKGALLGSRSPLIGGLVGQRPLIGGRRPLVDEVYVTATGQHLGFRDCVIRGQRLPHMGPKAPHRGLARGPKPSSQGFLIAEVYVTAIRSTYGFSGLHYEHTVFFL